MPNTYSWMIENMKVCPNEGGLTNVVKKVMAYYIANDGNGTIASQVLNVTLGTADPQNFTPFASLTESQVISWVETLVSVSSLQPLLDEFIEDKKLVSEECPWDA